MANKNIRGNFPADENVMHVNSIADLKAIVVNEDVDTVVVSGYFVKGDNRSRIATFDAISTDADDGGITIIPTYIGFGGTGRWKFYNKDLSLRDFGAVGDGVANDTAALANAFAYSSSNTLVMTVGTFLTDASIKIPTGSTLTTAGTISDSCVIKATAILAATTPPTLGGTHTPTPDFPPVMYCDGIQWFEWGSFMIDGDNLDVIGLFMNEAFIGNYNGIRISNTNQNPLVGIRCQVIHFDQPSWFLCGQGTGGDGGVLFYDTTDLTFTTPDIERLGGDNCRYSMEIRQENNKGSWVFINPWFETEGAGKKPTLGHFGVSGRLGRVTGHFATWASPTTESIIDLLEDGSSITRHNVVMGVTGAKGWEIDINDASGGLSVVTGAGTKGNIIKGLFTNTLITENSIPGDNQFILSSTFGHPTVIETFEIRDPVSGTTLPVSATSYRFKFDGNIVRMFGNDNNFIQGIGGNVVFQSNLNLTLRSLSGTIQATVDNVAGNNFRVASDLGTSTWEFAHLILGPHHIWVDGADNLRIKNGAPTSDTDGTVVGTQT